MKEDNLQWQFIKVDFGESFRVYDGYFNYEQILEAICCLHNIEIVKYILNNTIIICSTTQLTVDELIKFEEILKKRLLDEFKQKIYCCDIDNHSLEFDEDLSFDIIPGNPSILSDYNMAVVISPSGKVSLNSNAQQILQPEIIERIVNEFKEDIIQYFQSFLEEITVTHFRRSEILVSFVIEVDIADELFSCLIKHDHIKIQKIAEEKDLLEEIDYNASRYSDNHLIHNIRKTNIIIGEMPSSGVGVFFIGYIMYGRRMEVTLKAFEYHLVEDLLNFLENNIGFFEMKGNLRWEKLMSRLVKRGLQPTNDYILGNELMKMFLRESIKDYFAEEIKFIIQNLHGKGYLTKDEYTNNVISKPDGRSVSIIGGGLGRFFTEYLQFNANANRQYWVNPSSGTFYEYNSGENHNKIVESKSDIIYAPKTDSLLYYIRTFWHQEFVYEIIAMIKEQWSTKGNPLQILQIEKDFQFDFNNPTVERESKDIDLLVRLCNEQLKKEFIIAVEAKRDTKYYPDEIKSIPVKIGLTYANIFNGFIFIGYFDCLSRKSQYRDPNKQKIRWEKSEFDSLEKSFVLCSGYLFSQLVNDVETAIIQICQQEQ